MASPLNIALCLSHFYPTLGGAENQLFSLAKEWVKLGHRVVVLTRALPETPQVPPLETVEGVEIHREIRPWALGPLFGLTFVTSLMGALWRQMRQVDVVVAGQAPWEAVVTGVMGPRYGKGSVVVFQQSGPFGDIAQLKQTKGGRFLRRLLLRNRRFIALSQEQREEAIALGCPAAAVRVLYSGVDTQRFYPPENLPPSQASPRDQTVLFVGRLVEQKNPLLLLESWRRLPQQPHWRLRIVGAGPLQPALESFCHQHHLANVEWAGTGLDMPAQYRAAAVFVLPSRGEGCPNVLLEAMASGCGCLASDIGGSRDVIAHESNGLLVPVNDVTALTHGLERLLKETALRQRLGQSARSHVEHYHSLAFAAESYLEVFREALPLPGAEVGDLPSSSINGSPY